MSGSNNQRWPADRIQRRLRADESLIEMVRAERVFLASRPAKTEPIGHAIEGSEGPSEMTDEPLPRFLIRRDASGGWMVWDRQTKGPAKYEGKTAVDLPEDQAREIRDELRLHYIAKG